MKTKALRNHTSSFAGTLSHTSRIALALLLALALVPFAPSSAFAESDSSEPSQEDIDAVSNILAEAAEYVSNNFIFTENGQILRIDTTSGQSVSTLDTSNLPQSYVAPHTSVKNQGAFGTCWSFATLGAFESAQLVQQGVQGSTDTNTVTNAVASPDYAEAPLVYGAYHPRLDAEGNDDPTCSYTIPEPDSFEGFDAGGNWYQASSLLAQWRGAVAEEKAPYVVLPSTAPEVEKQAALTQMIPSSRSVDQQSDLHLDSSVLFADPAPVISGNPLTRKVNTTNRKFIQQNLMTTGALTVSFCAGEKEAERHYGESVVGATYNESGLVWEVGINSDETRKYPKKNFACYYDADTNNRQADHVVTLVGWDDTYSRFNFMKSAKDDQGTPIAYDTDIAEVVSVQTANWTADRIVPKSDGAWIIKNSWGTGAGKEGYMWIPYEDKTVCDIASFIPEQQNAAGVSSYEISNQYDECMEEVELVGSSVQTANVFTAEEDQVVEALGMWTSKESCTIEAKVYTSLGSPTNPESGTLAASLTKSASSESFRTWPLSNSVKVKKGEQFSVVMTYKAGNEYGIPFELGIPDESHVYRAAGQSFAKASGGAWVDVTDTRLPVDSGVTQGNVAVKAFSSRLSESTLELKTGSVTEPSVAKTYDGAALSLQDFVANAQYGSQPAEEGDVSFSYTSHIAARAAGEATAGLPTNAGVYDVTVTLAEKEVGGVWYAEKSATTALSIEPAAFTYAVDNQDIAIGSDIGAVRAPASATGVNGETVAGSLLWFNSEARAQTLPSNYTFSGEAKAVVPLYWTFAPAAGQTNYVDTPATGTTQFTLVRVSKPKPLAVTGDASAPLAATGAVLMLGALATALYARKRKHRS